jgi:ribosome-associated toxin RatA of RatAB toxin-antitoxin module
VTSALSSFIVGAQITLCAVGILEGESTAEIDAPVERVWELIADVERGPEWQAGIKAIVALERDDEGRPTLADTEADAKLRVVRTRVRFDYEPPTRLTWQQTKGDLKSLSGMWELTDLGDGRTAARYWAGADLGRLGLLVRGPIIDLLRAQLAGRRANELKTMIEGDA